MNSWVKNTPRKWFTWSLYKFSTFKKKFFIFLIFLHKIIDFVKKNEKNNFETCWKLVGTPSGSFSRSIFRSGVHFSHLEVDWTSQNQLFRRFLLNFHLFDVQKHEKLRRNLRFLVWKTWIFNFFHSNLFEYLANDLYCS